MQALFHAYSGSWSILEDRDGNVRTGAYGQGAQRHNHGEMETLPTVSRHPFAFLEDRQDRLWIGGNFGLNYLDRDTLHRYAPPHFATDRLEWVASLHEAPDGGIWIPSLSGANNADTENTQSQFESISNMAGRALQNARGMAYNLRPFELDRVGFKEAVETMALKVSETSDSRYFIDIDELEGVLSEQAQIYLYRLLQEALNNILEHAKASVVMLEIKVESGCVQVQLEDNGAGFDRNHCQRGLGLAGMEERAKLIGGTFELTSSPGEGARLRIKIPAQP